jgi:peptide chain release factor subunit 1
MTPQLDQITAELDRLALLEPTPFPFISLYLDLRPDQHGRDHFDPFIRKELGERLRTYEADGPARSSLEADCERIRGYLADVDRSANGLALFACSGLELFDAVQLAAPIPEHRLCIADRPHLYPLARVRDEYPRYAAVHADTRVSRIFVVAANTIEQRQQVEGQKTRRHKMGGWSQARYQRHVENYHHQHVKEVVDTLGHIVRSEGIELIVIAGDDIAVPLIKDALPKELADRVVDVVKIGDYASDRELVEATAEVIRENERATDRERVSALLDAYRAGGLAVVGLDETRRALERGQVDELVIAASLQTITGGDNATAGGPLDRTAEERVADDLIAAARQTAADVRFIEDASLLASVGGVGAHLRFKL